MEKALGPRLAKWALFFYVTNMNIVRCRSIATAEAGFTRQTVPLRSAASS